MFATWDDTDLEWLENEVATLSMQGVASKAGMRTTPMLSLVDGVCERAMQGERLLVSTPPQEGKSTRCSVLFPVVAMHRYPGLRVAVASYSSELAKQFSRRARDLTKQLYRSVIQAGEDRAQDWRLKNGSSYTAVGVGGSFTGRAVDLLIIDDPVKSAEDAKSKRSRELVWDWWQSVALTRLAPGAGVMVIMTRWHTDDLAGRLKAEGWPVLNIPAIAEQGPDEDPLGRNVGDWLESVRGRTAAQWEATRKALSDYFWRALYQGSPVAVTGKILDPANLQVVQSESVLRLDAGMPGVVWAPQLDVVTSWDLSFTGNVGSDYVVGQVWGSAGGSYYLLDQVRGQWSFTDTLEMVRQVAQRWPQARTHLVEQAANGAALIDMLGKTSGLHITPVTPRGSKELRALAVQPLLAAGHVRVMSGADWLPALYDELDQFPSGPNDDQVDALTQALAHFKPADAIRLT